MPYPRLYDVTYSYTGFQQAQGNNSFPGTQLDADLNGLESAIDGVAAFIQNVMRSDGKLQNGVVTYDSLSPSLQTAGLAPATTWATGVSYGVNTSAIQNSNLYRCLIPHTSGVFATDLAAGNWAFVASLASAGDMVRANNLSDVLNVDIARENIGALAHPATRAALAAFDTTKVTSAFLSEAGREGLFVWRTGDYSTLVTADPQQGIYVKATAIAASAGTWERIRTSGVYNVKWFGAKGDFPTTNDYTAIQAAINLAGTLAGGDVLFPQGGYRIDTGLTITTPLTRLIGVGKRYCSLQSTITTISMVTVSAARCGVENLSIFNQVQPTTANGLIKIAAGAVQCTFRDLDMVGGWYCIYLSGGANCLFGDIVAREAWGGNAVYGVNAGAMIFENCVFDQDWPSTSQGLGAPASANDKGARANTTAYVLKDYVNLGGMLLQCKVAGTTAAAPPSLTGVWYNQDIVDGTVTWRVAGNASGSAVQVDSGCTYVTFKDTDMTGSYVYGAQVTNGLGATAPDVIRFNNVTIAGTISHGINIVAGKGLWIEGCEIQACLGAAAVRSGISIGSGITGELTIRGNRVTSGFVRGVDMAANSFGSVVMAGNMCFGMSGAGINVQANATDFTIVDNNVGSSALFGNNAVGINVAAGSSNNYTIRNNRTNGLATEISDGGTGTNKIVDTIVWTTYTPTVSSGSGTFTSASAVGRYKKIGKTVFLNVVITITTNGTAASFGTFTLPFNSAAASFFGGRSSNGNLVGGQNSAGSGSLSYSGATAAYVGGDGTTIVFDGVYESQ